MYDAAVRRDIDAMKEFQKRIYRQRRLYSIGNHQQCLIKAVKTALMQQGICNKYLVRPGKDFEPAEEKTVAEIVKTI